MRLIVVGTEHYGEYFGRKRRLSTVTLVREPNNRYDPNAVAVFVRSRRVGYISASYAAVIAPAVDYWGGWVEVPVDQSGAYPHVEVPDDWVRRR